MSEYSSVLDILNSKTTNRVFTVINFNNNKKYGVDVSNVINFYKNYCESLNIKDLNHWDVHPIFALGEVTDDIMPIIGEFIFRFDGSITLEDDDEDGLYSRELVNGVVACFQETIKELFFLGSKGSELICCVSESRKWKQDGKICVKMKLQFPYCKTDRKFANTIFRSKVIQKLRQNKLNQLFIESTPIGDWDTHLEEVKNYYPFYGSTDNTKRPPCFFSGVFADQADDIPLERVYEYTTHQFISGDKCIIDQVEGLEDPDMERSDHKMFLSLIFNFHF